MAVLRNAFQVSDSEEVYLTDSTLEENAFTGDTFWKVVCPALEREGILALYSNPDDFASDFKVIEKFRTKQLTGPQVYKLWDGCLVSDMLTADGNAFSQAYFDFEKGKYLNDYKELLASKLPSLFHVEDTWDNYRLIAQRIDERYKSWKDSANG